MSVENVNQFHQVVLQDSVLKQQLQAITDKESLVNLAVQLGQQQGYHFTSEEAAQALVKVYLPAAAHDEEEELQM